MSGGSKGQTKQVTTSEPNSIVKPYLAGAYKDVAANYKQGAPAYYPGQTVAPMSQYTTSALDQMAQRATAGSDVTRGAQQQIQGTLNGDYLNQGNPAFQGALDAAIRPITQNYMNTVMPSIDSQFSAAGRYGGGAHEQAATDTYANMGRQIGDTSAQMAYQNYGDERARQMQAAALAPDMANADYNDISKLGLAGSAYDQFNQDLINADKTKYDYNANKNSNWISQNLGLLNGTPWGQSQTTSGGRPSIFSGALSGGLAGAGVGNLIPGIGGATGGLIGGGIGVLNSLF